jgi:hypothetical protein
MSYFTAAGSFLSLLFESCQHQEFSSC